MIETYTDETPMQWGKFQGTKMKDVPAWYLISMYNKQQLAGDLNGYVERNLDALYKRKKEENNFKK